ncbi:MAG TPA: hypothetical protein VGR78_13905 [Verrucomicrobiae bacterium]|nr:hypothetical protein [Verrucomicrobiae bacterium]
MDRILMIKESLRCLKLGWLCLLPVFGAFLAIYTIRIYCHVFLTTRDEWNPAKPQLYSGAALALASLLLHSVVVSTIIWSAVK